MPPPKTFPVTAASPLLAFLFESFDLNRKKVKNLLKYGAVSVNGVTIRQFDHPLVHGDVVTVSELKSAIASNQLQYARIQLVHEDEAVLVLDKPAGLLTVATDREKADTLFVRLNDFLDRRAGPRRERAHVVHRLDQDTSGLVLFAKTMDYKTALQDTWSTVEKYYLAIVEGKPPREQGTVKTYLSESRALKVHSHSIAVPGAQLATTHYRLLESREAASLLEVRLETGRKHQIRVQLAHLGCPVAGDARYGARTDPYGRLALHAWRLSFIHPQDSRILQFESPLPSALRW